MRKLGGIHNEFFDCVSSFQYFFGGREGTYLAHSLISGKIRRINLSLKELMERKEVFLAGLENMF